MEIGQFMGSSLKPFANRHNIVGQKFPTLLNVTCCVCLHTLLHVVRSCCGKIETGQTYSYMQMKKTTHNNVGSCWPKTLLLFAWGSSVVLLDRE